MHCRTVVPVLIVALLLLAAVLPTCAQDRTGNDLMVMVMNYGGTEPSPFHDFIIKNILLETRRASLLTVSAGDTEIVPDPANPTTVSEAAQAMAAVLALTAAYAIDEGGMTITFRIFDAVERVLLGETIERAPVDLALDRMISRGLAGLIPILTERLTRYPARVTDGARAVDEHGQIGSAAVQESRDGTNPAQIGVVTIGPTVEPPMDRGDAIALIPGIGPFVTTGAFGAFIDVGISLSLAVHYEINSNIALGLYSAVNGFMAKGPLASAQGVLAPAGLDFRYQRDLDTKTSIYGRAGGGPALFLVNTEDEGTLMKLIPFTTLGLGFVRMREEKTGVSFDLAFEAFLESGELLMGIVPSINLIKRL